MSLLLAARRRSASTDTFIIPRRQVLWPQLATVKNGTWSWNPNINSTFGGYFLNTSQTTGDYLEFPNVVFEEGATYRVQVIGAKTSSRTAAVMKVGGVSTGVSLNMYSASTQFNQKVAGTFTAPASGTVRFETTGSGFWSVSQIEITRVSGGTGLGSSLDDLPWHGSMPPYLWSAASGTPVLTGDISQRWGCYVRATDGSGEYIEIKAWIPQGSITFDFQTMNTSDSGILSLSIDGGASVGTVDLYSASTAYNQTSTISTTIATTGIHTIRITCSGTSGSFYRLYLAWVSWRKTAATGAIAATGTTYGVESREIWPWFAEVSNFTNFSSSTSNYLNIVHSQAVPSQGGGFSQNIDLRPGTYSITSVNGTDANRGIVHVSVDGGADLATFDTYSGSATYAVKSTVSASLSSGQIDFYVDSKNASSTDYAYTPTLIRLVRTGA